MCIYIILKVVYYTNFKINQVSRVLYESLSDADLIQGIDIDGGGHYTNRLLKGILLFSY